ncbi:MAG: amidohydrolase [Gemmatimonadota bacterium]|nr:amidohydrolase [Gemmatimonadota bacterium]
MRETSARTILRLAVPWVALWVLIPASASANQLTVYPARRIITMDPSLPSATAVAVRDDRIVAVGTMETLEPWLEVFDYEVDETFRDKVLLPGFIDPHLHPDLAVSLLARNEIITPEDWDLPSGFIEGVTDRAGYLARLRELVDRDPDSDKTFFTWGYNAFWHGLITRQDLDAISATRPIVVTQRSSHEVVLNTAALDAAQITAAAAARVTDGVDWEAGRFWERGQSVVQGGIARYLRDRDAADNGLALVADLIHRGGVTTISTAGSAPRPGSATWTAFDSERIPFRTLMVPRPGGFNRRPGATLSEKFENDQASNTGRMIYTKGIKFMLDGAMFAQYMQMGPPGYIDGHQGEWLMPPEQLKPQIEPFWQSGFDINIHVNGDLGVDVTLDALEDLLEEYPRPDHRYILQHFGFSRQDQATRLGRLNGVVSATGYYLWQLGDKYAEVGIGSERADQMIRLGSLVRNGVRVTLHSDLPMGPVRPLLAVWSVTTRKTASGTVRGPDEALTLDQALRAVTVDAAWSLRMDHEIGSIAAGKKADFAVLEEDPFAVSPDDVKDIEVWGTVFEGQVFPVLPIEAPSVR